MFKKLFAGSNKPAEKTLEERCSEHVLGFDIVTHSEHVRRDACLCDALQEWAMKIHDGLEKTETAVVEYLPSGRKSGQYPGTMASACGNSVLEIFTPEKVQFSLATDNTPRVNFAGNNGTTMSLPVGHFSGGRFTIADITTVELYKTVWVSLMDALTAWRDEWGGDALDLGNGCSINLTSARGDTTIYLQAGDGTHMFNIDYLCGRLDFIERLNSVAPHGCQSVAATIEQHRRFDKARRHAKMAASKGCQFSEGEFVKLVPLDLNARLKSTEDWECFKVLRVLTDAEKLQYVTTTASYIPDMILIDLELKKFAAFSGDYIPSVRFHHKNKKRRQQ